MIKKGIHSVFLFLFCFQMYSQSSDSLAVNFHLQFGKTPLELNKKYVSNKDTLTIETFRCYISNIQIQYQDNSVYTQNKSYLIDLNHANLYQIPLTKKTDKQISKITFNVGIDSVRNNSGALTGDLDPINGMYWAWQSGYINMKIEGKSPSCKTRKNKFEFHIGGYLQPYYAMRQLAFDLNKNADSDIEIIVDLKSLFSNIQLRETNSVMIPGKEGMKLADYSTKMFSLQ